MGSILSGFISELPFYLLSLPIILLALSVHEASHGFVALKLGDPTARNLGRLTLNPFKHFDLLGFIFMLVFHFGWAKPVPISSRNFKKPRRDIALSSAAGPVSNILLSFIFAALLRLVIHIVRNSFLDELLMLGSAESPGIAFNMMCVLTYMLNIGVILNTSLAVFNLLPIPPFDGSRIAYLFLPPKIYFGLMKYERYIMLGILFAFYFIPFFGSALSAATGFLADTVLAIFGMSRSSEAAYLNNLLLTYLTYSVF